MFRVSLVLFTALFLFSTRAGADTQLGARLSEFHSAFGKPSFQEHLGRTSNVRWTPLRTEDATLAAVRVFGVDVSALDGVVCRVVVRCRRRLSDAETTRVAQRFFPRRYRAAQFAEVRQQYVERTQYKLDDGDYVDSGPYDNRHIVVISDKTYWHNVEVFDGEAAKVRPPTSNH